MLLIALAACAHAMVPRARTPLQAPRHKIGRAGVRVSSGARVSKDAADADLLRSERRVNGRGMAELLHVIDDICAHGMPSSPRPMSSSAQML